MAAVPVLPLAEAALELRAASPAQWEKFVLEFRKYTAMTTAQLVNTPPDLFLRSQGRAQLAEDLSGVFQNAPDIVEKARTQLQTVAASQKARNKP